jgi:hypothetical protein
MYFDEQFSLNVIRSVGLRSHLTAWPWEAEIVKHYKSKENLAVFCTKIWVISQ